MRAKFINELALASIKPEELVSNDIIKQWIDDEIVCDNLIYGYAQENYEDPEELIDSETFRDSKEFYNWVKYELAYKFEDVIDNFKSGIIKDDHIRIWRVITVKDNWIEHLEKFGGRVGEYWAWSKGNAEAHWGFGAEKNTARIESIIHVDHVDWVETINLNANPSYEEETEVRLFKNTPIKIVGLEINNEPVDISRIKNKTFKA